ncbi:uncharacterized protein LOC105445422 [Strongylocentrotus purpuratus]|uniref:Sushi domain-containing protein n=1 Tax=Strongylocentrotus purpuratus TaxID=7668 RepID=A0A7M7N477_STRPU|nr:uncharacterized protein LOC105445422 [Strongylocentrotus purpuratus]
MDGYSLKGNGTLQCVPGGSQFYLLWNDSIPTCEEVTVTDKPTVVTEQFKVFDITSSVHMGMASTPTKVPPYSKECVPPTTQTLVFMGTTGGLAVLLLFIASCWIVSRIRRHLSTKHVAKKEVTHTYLDMSRSLQRGDTQNQGTALNETLSRPLPGTQSRDEEDKDTKHLKPTVVYYESIPSNKLNVNYESATDTVPADKLEGHYESATNTVLSDLPESTYVNAEDEDHLKDVEQDDFGYILPSTQPILTVPSNVLPSQVRQSGGQFRPRLTYDEDGYLDPRL